MHKALTCRLISDIHAESMEDWGIDFAKSLPSDGIDVLLVAGDLGTIKQAPQLISILCARFPNVIMVCGNHEFYESTRDEVIWKLSNIDTSTENFYFLNRTVAVIQGVVFAGATFWWKPSKDDPTKEDVTWVKQFEAFMHTTSFTDFNHVDCLKKDFQKAWAIREQAINDLFRINGIFDWIQEEFKRDLDFVESWMKQADVMVTHMAPSSRSLSFRFVQDPRSRYYFNSVDNLLSLDGPQYWVHGHVHDPCEYILGRTKVLCAPKGYPIEHGSRAYAGKVFRVVGR